MRYQPDYCTATTGDFAAIKSALPAAGNCYWSVTNPAPATCDWPLPVADGQSALDDLWHAAVNGRGKFYSAVNPNALAAGLTGALNDLNTTTASAAAAATSSPNVSQGNQRAFSTTYQTATWSGKVYAQTIEADGTVDAPHLWDADQVLLGRVFPTSDTRTLLLFDPTRANKLKDFRFTDVGNGALDAVTEQPFFKNKCVPLSTMAQCGTLNFSQQSTVNAGPGLVNFLRGQQSGEGTLWRDRTELDPVTNNSVNTVLGDIINAQPVDVTPPFLTYENETTPELPGEKYADYKTRTATRRGQLIVAANDGFVHDFDPDTGFENWGYLPRFLIPAMYQLADSGYPGQHRYFVDGSPEAADVFDAVAGVWKTIVVGGANSGGRGFYALDITDPQNPKGLWEFCSDPAWCPNDTTTSPVTFHNDPDLGFSYGNPVIGRRQSDGKWVVVLTSGLNNVGVTGNGQGYFYVLDAITGAILHKVGTGLGSATDPSGLMKIGAYYPQGQDDPLFQRVYGGDQKGNVWRVDMSAPNMLAYPGVTTIGMTNPANNGRPIIQLLTTFLDGSGRIQPITARPAGTHLGNDAYNPDTRIYYVGTGRFLGNSDLADQGPGGVAWQQSLYGVRDRIDEMSAGAFVPLASFRSGNTVQQTISQGSGGNRVLSKLPVDWKAKDGFFIDLNPFFTGDPATGNSPGERVTLDVRLIHGTLIYIATIPNSGGSCTPGGDTILYTLDYATGGYVGNDATAGHRIGAFLVGAAIIQTSQGIKVLGKTLPGQNIPITAPIDTKYLSKRFSYRER
jgi:type IV pilus assembly protein PilY1